MKMNKKLYSEPKKPFAFSSMGLSSSPPEQPWTKKEENIKIQKWKNERMKENVRIQETWRKGNLIPHDSRVHGRNGSRSLPAD